jgi:hypothetical protein
MEEECLEHKDYQVSKVNPHYGVRKVLQTEKIQIVFRTATNTGHLFVFPSVRLVLSNLNIRCFLAESTKHNNRTQQQNTTAKYNSKTRQ